MIELEPIEKTILLVILTGNLRGVRPLSAIIIALVESAKTASLAQYASMDGVLYLNNFTPTSFAEQHLQSFNETDTDEYVYHHLIIPDLLNCISRQKYLVDSTITFLNSFTEEGVKEIDSKAFAGDRIILPQPVCGGVITSIAHGDFERRWKKWSSVGFLSRFLPISYQYGEDVVNKILQASAKKNEAQLFGKPYSMPRLKLLKDSLDKVEVVLPDKLAEQLIKPAKGMQKRLSTYGFRATRHLRRLVQANALLNERVKATQEDVDEVLRLSEFLNFNYTVVGKEPPPEGMDVNKPKSIDIQTMQDLLSNI